MEISAYLKKHAKRTLILVILASALAFFIPIKFIIFFLIVVYFNAHVAKLNMMSGLPTEIELSTFSTIIIAKIFGLKFGIFTAIMSKLIANIYTGRFIMDHVFMVMNYCVAAFIASALSSIDIVILGFIIVILNNFTMFLISHNLLGISPPKNFSYAVSNIIFNFMMFYSFGEIIVKILA